MGSVTPRRACAAVAALAVALLLGWSAAKVYFVNGGDWTALFYTGTRFPLPPELSAVYRVAPDGYDGQFYRLLAHDPSLAKNYGRYADAPRYRFRRLLIPLLAWFLALGRQSWIDTAYIAVEMVFAALGAYWCARLLARRGRTPWWGLLYLAVPATLASIDRMLLDGPLTALFAGFLLYCEEERWGRVWIFAALAALTRETGLLLAAALVADRLLNRNWRGAAAFAASAIPAMAWYAYVDAHLPPGRWSSEIGIPLLALLRRFSILRTYSDPAAQFVLRTGDFLAVAGLIACVILAAGWLWKARLGPVSICVALHAALALFLGAKVMIDPFAFGRVISPLVLWIMIEAVVRRKWAALAPPLGITFGVSLVFVRPAISVAQALLRR